ncbi:MAG: hypothetical protein JWQ42_425 [Edaphobacter sp.]|nr:hypothetical protein [Edaphobacter sp.]
MQSAHFGSNTARKQGRGALHPHPAQAQARLRKMVLDSVASAHSKRNYAKALSCAKALAILPPVVIKALVKTELAPRFDEG